MKLFRIITLTLLVAHLTQAHAAPSSTGTTPAKKAAASQQQTFLKKLKAFAMHPLTWIATAGTIAGILLILKNKNVLGSNPLPNNPNNELPTEQAAPVNVPNASGETIINLPTVNLQKFVERRKAIVPQPRQPTPSKNPENPLPTQTTQNNNPPLTTVNPLRNQQPIQPQVQPAVTPERRRPGIISFVTWGIRPDEDINSQDELGNTLLMDLVRYRYVQQIENALAVPGINVNLRTNHRYGTALMTAVHALPDDSDFQDENSGKLLQIIEKLVAVQGIDTQEYDAWLIAELRKVARGYNKKSIAALSKLPRFDINGRDHENHNRTALMMAAEWRSPDVIEELLTMPHLDLNAQDDNGYTALQIGAAHLLFDCTSVELLLNAGADHQLKGRDGEPLVLTLARRLPRQSSDWRNNEQEYGKGLEKIIIGLLPKVPKTDLNARDPYGNTALIHAAKQYYPKLYNALLGAEPTAANIRDNKGNLPQEILQTEEWHRTRSY